MVVDKNKYNVAIVGGGITGTALLYALSNYTNVHRIVLFEKYGEVGSVNTHHKNNSQTLHFGDIETNYTLEKAKRVKEAAEMLVRFLESRARSAFTKNHKMVLAVGDREARELETRYEEFRGLFPKLKKIGREEIAKLEPNVVLGRGIQEKILAIATEDGYAVNYKKLSESFVAESRKAAKDVDVFLNTETCDIWKKDGGYLVSTTKGKFYADAVAVMAGPYSLVFAKKLGYGQNLGILSVAGSFYCAQSVLHGKVYTMQIKKLPFAAIHGDPDVNNPSETRFGPTAKVLPLLERHRYSTMLGFFKVSVWSLDGILSLLKIIFDKVLFFYILKNISYDLPIIGKLLFLREAKKIVPTLRYADLNFGKGIGGIRPQVVNTKTKKLEMGEAEIIGDKILFNITPSPGASVSLKNAEQDALKIINFLKEPFYFDEKRWCKDFGSAMSECKE